MHLAFPQPSGAPRPSPKLGHRLPLSVRISEAVFASALTLNPASQELGLPELFPGGVAGVGGLLPAP